MNNNTSKPRLIYIDIARAIAILFVVMGHINQFYRDKVGIPCPQMLKFIYTFHIPLFFVISGILFSEKSVKKPSFWEFLLKKVKALIVPYLFLDITGGLYSALISSSINVATFKKIVVNTLTLQNNIGADWFISALFIGEIFLYFFLKYYRNIYKCFAWIPFLLIYVYYPFSTYGINVIVRGVIAFTFMLSGYYLKEYYQSDMNSRWDLIILSFVLTYAISIFNGQIDIWDSSIGNPFLCLAGGIIGAYWVIGLSKRLTSKVLVFIGQNTITMMTTHMILIGLIWSFLSKTLFSVLPTWGSNIYGAIIFLFWW